jgi:hypothetical protein
MNDDHAFERATRELLEDGSDRTPAAVIDAVLLAVRTTPQERDLRIPWRIAPMSTPMRLVAAIAVIVVAGFAAFNLIAPSSGVGGVPRPSPTVTPSAPAPTLSPQPSPSPIDTATWTTYVSNRYGFSIGHPADWTVRPANGDWTFPANANANPYDSTMETFVSADSSVAASSWSVAVTPGTTVDAWVQAYCLRAESDTPCTSIKGRTVATALDGHAGSFVSFAQDTQAFILVQNRMYVVAIWQSADYIPGGIVPKLLSAYLSTMHLLPGGPAPAATSPAPS